jgi:hypothetical protein
MGLNPDWTQPRLGLNPEWTQPRLGLNPEWTELRMGLNLEFLSTSKMVYNVYKYQKNGFKKRENTDRSISVKKGYQGLNIHEFSSMLKKLETIKMFFTAV